MEDGHDAFLSCHGECRELRLEYIDDVRIHFVTNAMGLGRAVEFRCLAVSAVMELRMDVLIYRKSQNFAHGMHFQTD